MVEKINEAVKYIIDCIKEVPDFAIVLGSGLKKLVDEVQNPIVIPYQNIPHFPVSTVQGHGGDLIFGTLAGKKVLMMSGRFHYYEGYDMQTVTFPIRVFGVLGIKNIILSNASGGVNDAHKVGDVMLITDHINFLPEHPLRGKNIDAWGPRFVDMSQPYDAEFLKAAVQFCEQNKIKVHQGVYLALSGPTFETPAEYGMVKNFGADAVGMSTVPEVIVAKHMNLRVFALSVITDLGGPNLQNPVSHDEVLQAADTAMPKVIQIVQHIVKTS
ncbi:purine-nucleoside phosphorylase [Flavobacterium agricola]|uniref:Purine nucleoside phosphorylase n=1 Tax=Flavobacterium agricola TaxID=2870839 RepID=A0ABY6M267_9FLAO|nr:purine-nucleoside phosphorylase [Flavobacterium agricola]UYW01206.1 purine-nucleoside phosphorylase [Flavobacterium agricola]